ncbi:TetR/AcrR family transcriptional regulator [Isoptericola sp. b441]|uniref:TetR/AcrR family transcriptional regulator n=1 Tax=Actinotalea lenta TaxID=3064654 RepID=A0ABT9D6A6_9CELL|nr:TetR/AcrR family transcriptional regulator [Isoptericola sp. b441]MDO8106364.1 TetR/AcrR family transcriptional regulator [Isoptericola sp. b441]
MADRTLTRDRVLAGALALADEIGVEAFTMRRLAAALGTKPMSIYYHVPGKEEILDGIVDLVFGEIEAPPTSLPWTEAMRRRCRSAREVLRRHPWAPPLMESRTSPGPLSLAHHDAVIRCLREGGLSWQWTAHAYATLDAFVYGFALQEAALPFGGGEELGDLASELTEALPTDRYPHFVAFTVEHVLQPGYRFADSFDVGLDLILAGLSSRARDDSPPGRVGGGRSDASATTKPSRGD